MCALKLLLCAKKVKMQKNLKQLLNEHGINLKKAFGQNFLTDEILLADIVKKSGIDGNTRVLEIGPGAGALTRHLAENALSVHAYEIDTRLKPVLDKTVGEYSNVQITFADIMKEKIEMVEKRLGGNYVLVANLPYYITTPIVMNFLENAKNLKSMVIMVQKEVAQRFSAKESTSDYGAITVGINLRGDAKIILDVPREKFTPVPNVDSAVVKIDIDKDKNAGENLAGIRELVKVGFSARRKTLVNNLINLYKMSREQAESALISAGIDIKVRGENLSSEDYVMLYKVLKGE